MFILSNEDTLVIVASKEVAFNPEWPDEKSIIEIVLRVGLEDAMEKADAEVAAVATSLWDQLIRAIDVRCKK